MLVTKKHKGICISIINPNAIPKIEERIREITAEMIVSKEKKITEEELVS